MSSGPERSSTEREQTDEQPSLRKGWRRFGGLARISEMARNFRESSSLTGLVLCCEAQEALFKEAKWRPGVPWPQGGRSLGGRVRLEASQRWKMPRSPRCTVGGQMWLQIAGLTCCPGLEGQLCNTAQGVWPAACWWTSATAIKYLHANTRLTHGTDRDAGFPEIITVFKDS